MTDKVKINAAAEQPPIPQEGHVPDVTSSTFEDWGQRLPIGLLRDGRLHRDFSFRRWTMREERALEKMRKKNRRLSMGALVTNIMAFMLTRLGPYDFEALDQGQRRLVVNQMWMPDVMYAYISLRIDALGPEVKFEVECSRCAHSWKFPADLARTDVKIAENPEALVRAYRLRDGIEPPTGVGGEAVCDVLLQPPLWQAMAALKQNGNMGDVKLFLMSSAMRQIGEGKIPVIPEVLEGLSKFDLEHLQRAIDDLTPGPELTLEVPCPSCDHTNKRNLDWSWDFFFTASSL
jgi:hypothetical protein